VRYSGYGKNKSWANIIIKIVDLWKELKEKRTRESLWHVDPLLGNIRETNKKTTAVIRRRPVNRNRGMVFYVRSSPIAAHATMNIEIDEWCFMCGPCVDIMSRTISESAVQCSGEKWRIGWWVSEWVRGLLRFTPCELLLLEAGSWGTGIVWESRIRGTSAVASRYRATVSEDMTVDASLCVTVIYKV
jgi:hypothetical protein